VKERMPWDKRNSLDVDEEWRQRSADAQDGKQKENIIGDVDLDEE